MGLCGAPHGVRFGYRGAPSPARPPLHMFRGARRTTWDLQIRGLEGMASRTIRRLFVSPVPLLLSAVRGRQRLKRNAQQQQQKTGADRAARRTFAATVSRAGQQWAINKGELPLTCWGRAIISPAPSRSGSEQRSHVPPQNNSTPARHPLPSLLPVSSSLNFDVQHCDASAARAV